MPARILPENLPNVPEGVPANAPPPPPPAAAVVPPLVANNYRINAANIAKYSRSPLLPVMLDIATGDLVVKGDRAGTRMGFLEARGRTPADLHRQLKAQVGNLKAANKAEANAAAAAAAAKARSAEEARRKAASVALERKAFNTMQAAQRTQFRQGLGDTKTRFLGTNLRVKEEAQRTKLLGQLGTLPAAQTAAASAARAADAARADAAAKAAAAQAARAAAPQKGFFSRMFGMGGGSRRHKRSTRRRSTRRHR